MAPPASLFKHILITGASSGIGAALANHYAGPDIVLALQGRDETRLRAVAEKCQAKGARVITGTIDVTDEAALAAWILAVDQTHPLDLVIANAGISAGGRGLSGSDAEAKMRHVFDVNLNGVLNTLFPILDAMRHRRHGTLALMSSLASFRGLPGSPAYGASKAAVRLLGESLRTMLKPDNVSVSVICPGFIATPMTADNRFAMPFLQDVDRSARRIAQGLAKNEARIAFPRRLYALAMLLTLLPHGVVDRLVKQ